jgi:hypothetical protein
MGDPHLQLHAVGESQHCRANELIELSPAIGFEPKAIPVPRGVTLKGINLRPS